MSLLLDALKKSEAQRRRGTTPTIDLTRTPPSGNPRRPASRWLPVLLVVLLLAAAAPWLWPKVSDWMEQRRGGPEDSAALSEADGAASPSGASESDAGDETSVAVSPPQRAPAPVAGASSPRRVAAEPTPAGGAGQNPAQPGDDSDESRGETGDGFGPVTSKTADGDGSDAAAAGSDAVAGAEASDPSAGPSMAEMRRMVQARQQQQQPQGDAPTSSEPPAEPSGQASDPAKNFIRPWELPQAQRAEFPELSLTVHFYAERAADRFVLINGERYREGQRVGPGTNLVEIRQRGAVVEFGSYRVLIE